MAKPKIASIIKPTIVSEEKVKNTDIELSTKVNDHISNKEIHVDKDLRDAVTYLRKDVDKHNNDSNMHITSTDRDVWNNKETPSGAQSKANKVLASLDSHKEDYNIHTSKAEKDLFKDKYTRAETRNLLKHTLTGLKFLPAVATNTELKNKYPNPEFNSCVTVRSEKMTVIFNGTEWVDFNGLLTPEITEENDGLMTSQDKVKLDSIEEGANNYVHPDSVDIRHVSDAQVDFWNKKAESTLVSHTEDGLMAFSDKVKLDSIEEGANIYEHPEYHDPSIIKEDETHKFVTDAQISTWDAKAEVSYIDTTNSKTLSAAKSYSDAKISALLNSSESQLEVLRSLAFDLKKDDTVKKFFDLFNECVKNKEFQEHSLNTNIHMGKSDRILLTNVNEALQSGLNPDWNETNTSSLKFIENKPTSLPANGGNADTVGGYTAEQLMNTSYFFDCAVKSEDNIDQIVNKINKGQLTNVLFRPGSYKIDKELVIRVSNATIKGIGNISKLLGLSIKIIGNNNTIENITIANLANGIVNKTALYIEGNNNVIQYNTIMNYNEGIIVEGSNNHVYKNTLVNIRNAAVKLTAENNSNYGNNIDNNEVKSSGLGIVLLSTRNSLTKNHITKNNVLNCSSGILLSNTINLNTQTIFNIISENIVMRGRGESHEYLANHKTIISEFSSKNIISSNITSGKEIVAPNNTLVNNIF